MTTTPEATETPQFHVAVIGAGFGGLGAGMALTRAGIDNFVILERAQDLGGTWHHNHYPDVGVDIPGVLYQFSYELNPNWSRTFPKGAEIKAYADACADKYRLREHLTFGIEVLARTWDETHHLWRLTTSDGAEVTARFVISAVGGFVEPKEPDIAGLAGFAGKVIRTQNWDHDYDLTGKRVAVIGTGATSVQMIPEVAKVAMSLDVYQRRAIWVFAKPDFTIPGVVQTLFRHAPWLQRGIRFAVSTPVDGALVAISSVGTWIAPLTTVVSGACRAYLFTQVRDKELRRELTPDYAYGCKRPGLSNVYYKAFTRPNVELITSGIAEVTPHGIRDVDGVVREIDVLVLATGFEMAGHPDVYRRKPIRGVDGFDLADFYQNNPAQAYEGVSLPGLPNHFMIFGPYSWNGSSWHVLVENVSRHAVRVIAEADRRGATAAEVTPAANKRYFDFIRERSKNALISGTQCAGSNTYYLDHHGDFSYLRPTSGSQATKASKSFLLSDYAFRTTEPASTCSTGAAAATPMVVERESV